MEKEQLDSLATVAVGSEKIPSHHYAPSEVYSSSESPPAYRPSMKSTAVQITKIIATTLIAVSFIIGTFILAGAWIQARSCSSEAIATMQVQQHEMFKKLQPEALIQTQPEARDSLQSLDVIEPTKDPQPDTKDIKIHKDDDDNNSKTDNESGDENENDDDYDEPEFTPIHIKLPVQLDLDDLAGTLMQQAKNLVSCVVERRRSDDKEQLKNTKRNGERVSIICESNEPRRQEQQEQEMLTPIIVPLGPMQIPMQQQDHDYHRYQTQNQYPIGANHRHNFINSRDIVNDITPQILQNIPQMMDPRMRNQGPFNQHPMRPIPIELRRMPIEMIRGMRPPMDMNQVYQQAKQQQAYQEQQKQQQQQQQQQQQTFQHQHQQQQQQQEHNAQVYGQEQQLQGMMHPPPPPPPSENQELPHENSQDIPRMMTPMVIRAQIESRIPQTDDSSERQSIFPFQGIQIRRLIQSIPSELKNIFQSGNIESRPMIPEGARREQVEEFKPFPETRTISLDSLMLPIEIRNVLEHGNIEGRRQDDSEEQQDLEKPTTTPSPILSIDEQNNDDEEKKLPADIKTFIHQIVEGLAFPVPMNIRPIESMEIPMEVRARVMATTDNDDSNNNNNNKEHQDEQEQSHADESIVQQQVPQQISQQQQQQQQQQHQPIQQQPSQQIIQQIPQQIQARVVPVQQDNQERNQYASTGTTRLMPVA